MHWLAYEEIQMTQRLSDEQLEVLEHGAPIGSIGEKLISEIRALQRERDEAFGSHNSLLTTVNALKAELASHMRMAEKGVYIPSQEFVDLVDSRDALKAELERERSGRQSVFGQLEAARAACERAEQERDQLRERVEKLREALDQTKTLYWERCYDGSGNIKALSVQEFSKRIDSALTADAAAEKEGEK